jgi:hypothetical protein
MDGITGFLWFAFTAQCTRSRRNDQLEQISNDNRVADLGCDGLHLLYREVAPFKKPSGSIPSNSPEYVFDRAAFLESRMADDGPMHNEVSEALKARDCHSEFLQMTAIILVAHKGSSKVNQQRDAFSKWKNECRIQFGRAWSIERLPRSRVDYVFELRPQSCDVPYGAQQVSRQANIGYGVASGHYPDFSLETTEKQNGRNSRTSA